MVKKDELKIGLKIRKKQWLNDEIYAKITAIGEKQVLIKYSENCLYKANQEVRYPTFVITKNWEICDDDLISREHRKNEYIGKTFKIKEGSVKIIDFFIHPNIKKECFIYTSKGNILGKIIEKERLLKEVDTYFGKVFNMNAKETLSYLLTELKERGYISYKDGEIIFKGGYED
jgi:hypothetical protein